MRKCPVCDIPGDLHARLEKTPDLESLIALALDGAERSAPLAENQATPKWIAVVREDATDSKVTHKASQKAAGAVARAKKKEKKYEIWRTNLLLD